MDADHLMLLDALPGTNHVDAAIGTSDGIATALPRLPHFALSTCCSTPLLPSFKTHTVEKRPTTTAARR